MFQGVSISGLIPAQRRGIRGLLRPSTYISTGSKMCDKKLAGVSELPRKIHVAEARPMMRFFIPPKNIPSCMSLRLIAAVLPVPAFRY